MPRIPKCQAIFKDTGGLLLAPTYILTLNFYFHAGSHNVMLHYGNLQERLVLYMYMHFMHICTFYFRSASLYIVVVSL